MLRNNQGFTIVELMVAALIMAVIMGALVMCLRIGDLTTAVGTEKADMESDVRYLMSWMVRDIRQAKIQELCENEPGSDYIKYNIWVWDDVNYTHQKSDDYVEYEYDPYSLVLTRRAFNNDTDAEVNFTGIAMSPFYTSYTDETANGFDAGTLLGTRRLIVAIKKEKIVRDRNLNFTLVEEIRIRNE